jgi:hypothetical protein
MFLEYRQYSRENQAPLLVCDVQTQEIPDGLSVGSNPDFAAKQ